jgi:L-amino acid N-acyltransferase YncA
VRHTPRVSAIPQPVRELAETPDRFVRLTPGNVDRVETDRYVVVRGPWWASVEGIRAAPDEVADVVREVREATVGRRATWRLGPSSAPPDLEQRLRALGLATPANGVEELVALATVTPPDAPAADVRRVETLDDYRTSVELRWDAFGKTDDQRAAERATLTETFEALRRSGAVVDFVAYVDGRPAATAACVVAERGLLLVGGSTLAWARGRGLYRALVVARWREAVRLEMPALVVQANPATSAPILERLGFVEVCRLRQLEDRVQRAASLTDPGGSP